jgi:oligopeptide transport system ATP-binding protein
VTDQGAKNQAAGRLATGGNRAPVVQVQDLTKVFKVRGSASEVTAVDGVSFELLSGWCLGIVGQSGSGKTTIARLLVGLERATSGTIAVGGLERSRPTRSTSERRRRSRQMQMVFQNPYTSLDPRQSVSACLAEAVRLHTRGMRSADLRARVQELLDQVGLDERQGRAKPAELSGGQRQRVAIARALAANPGVIVFDEAVSALDVSIQAQVLNLLADIRDQTATSYIFISHDLAVVRQIADEVVVLHNGVVVERGGVDDVLDHPKHQYTRLLRASVPRPGWVPTRPSVTVGERPRERR